MSETVKHYTVTYQLLKADGTPNGIPTKYPIRATSKEDAKQRLLNGHRSSKCKIISVIEDGK